MKAKSTSDRADREDTPEAHKAAYIANKDASRLHREFASKARESGDKDAAKNHDAADNEHFAKEEHHRFKAGIDSDDGDYVRPSSKVSKEEHSKALEAFAKRTTSPSKPVGRTRRKEWDPYRDE
jgi:hypothetical protein